MHKDYIQVISPYNHALDKKGVCRLGDDVVLTNYIYPVHDLPKSFRVKMPVAVLVEDGSIYMRINLRDIHAEAPALLILSSDDILELIDRSDNLHGKTISMSEHFISQLNLKNNFELLQAVSRHPMIPLNDDALQAVRLYYDLVERIISHTDNPNRLESLVSLTRATRYDMGYYLFKIEESTPCTRNEFIVNEFVQLVHTYCRQERRLEFYASKMCLSAKYLANVVAAHTDKPASRWIQEHVLLEAKAMLGVPNNTVAQVADALSFPDQSTFGKFFRRHTGLSPKEYQEQNK